MARKSPVLMLAFCKSNAVELITTFPPLPCADVPLSIKNAPAPAMRAESDSVDIVTSPARPAADVWVSIKAKVVSSVADTAEKFCALIRIPPASPSPEVRAMRAGIVLLVIVRLPLT